MISQRNYHTTKFFSENLLVIEMKNTQILSNKPVYQGPEILEISKIVMYELWYDIYKEISEDFEARFDTSNYELVRPLNRKRKIKSNWFNER